MKSKSKTNSVTKSRLIVCVVGLLLAEASPSQLTLVLTSNYDITLIAPGAVYHITNQAKVRNGKTFPIEFRTHRVDVTINTIGNGDYRATVILYERHDATWFKMTVEDLTFEAMFGAPVNLKWEDTDISVDLAIAVSISNQ